MKHEPIPFVDPHNEGGTGGVRCSCGSFKAVTSTGKVGHRKTMKSCWEDFRAHWNLNRPR